jgi:A/G-specific adenine glycosylase
MSKFSARVLDWYHVNKRSLPWRDHPDPYAVWVSEIMLQQTRVETVLPYFQRWMRRLPTISALANASEQEVLKLWEGLGYYARARNLRKAARLVLRVHGGALPRDPGKLLSLPGIGRYTAGAISSMSFGLDEPALDGNIRRVLARVFNLQQPADAPAGHKALWALASRHLPKGHAGEYNQALMDLGATVCLPKSPRCSACPVSGTCEARRLGIQADRPLRHARLSPPHRVYAAAVIARRGRVLLARRHSNGLLGGMWAFPNGPVEEVPPKGLRLMLWRDFKLRVAVQEPLGTVEHAYSHYSVSVHAFCCVPLSIPESRNLKWVSIGQLVKLPMGKVDRQIAGRLA